MAVWLSPGGEIFPDRLASAGPNSTRRSLSPFPYTTRYPSLRCEIPDGQRAQFGNPDPGIQEYQDHRPHADVVGSRVADLP